MLARMTLLMMGLFITYYSYAQSDYRLSGIATPNEQSLYLALDPNAEGYDGTTAIHITINQPTKFFELHAKNLTIHQATLSNQLQHFALEATELPFDKLQLSAPQKISAGSYILTIQFAAKYNPQSVGLYQVTEQNRQYLYTQFQTTDARTAFPVFDEPQYKIPFTITIDAPKELKVFANTPNKKQQPSSKKPEWLTHYFEETPTISSYLLAFAVGDFDVLPIRGLSIPGNIITTKGKKKLGKFASRITPKILAYMEKYFAYDYPFKKLDLIASPNYTYGAMENPGLILFRDSLLLINPKVATQRSITNSTMVIAHELAHMWYGDLVTMAWWDDLWLNEAFASWMARKTVITLFPNLEYDLRLPQIRALHQDAAVSSKAIRKPVNTDQDILDGLGLAYSKGESILAMLENWVTPPVMQQAIQAYMKKYAWKNTQAQDLWNEFSAVTEQPIIPMLQAFLNQPSYPLLSMSIHENKLTISQRPFSESTHGNKSDQWPLPIMIKYGNRSKETTQLILLTEQKQEFTLDFWPLWLFPDVNATGYYHWRMDDKFTEAAIKVANLQLSTKERIALINNNKALVDASISPAADYLKTIAEFLSDKHPKVVAQVLDNLLEMKKSIVTPENEAQWSLFIREIIQPPANRFGLTPAPKEAKNIPELRTKYLYLLAVDGKQFELTKLAQRKAKQFLKNPQQIEPALAQVYLSIAAYYGDRELVDTITTLFQQTTDPTIRSILLTGLGSFSQPKALQAVFDFFLSDYMNGPDAFSVISTVARREENKPILHTWLAKNYTPLKNKLPPYAEINLVTVLMHHCSDTQFTTLKALYAQPEFQFDNMDRELEKAHSLLNQCQTFRKNHLQQINRYLQQF